LALVKAFLTSGILTEDKTLWDTNAGIPQGIDPDSSHATDNPVLVRGL
jgi:hypothetical protein